MHVINRKITSYMVFMLVMIFSIFLLPSCTIKTGRFQTSYLLPYVDSISKKELLAIVESLPDEYDLSLDESEMIEDSTTASYFGRPYYYFTFWTENKDSSVIFSYMIDVRLGNINNYENLPNVLLNILKSKYGTDVTQQRINVVLP